MGKSNNLHTEVPKFCQREKRINDFLKEDEIKILENINNSFIKQITIDLSNFLKKNIQSISHSTEINVFNRKNIKNFRCVNFLEVSPFKSQSCIIFSENFLSVTIDFLFGGNGDSIHTISQNKDIMSSEWLLNNTIIKLITTCLSNIYSKFLDVVITFVDLEVFFDLQKVNWNASELFVINCFHFTINNTKVFFSILTSVSNIKKLYQKMIIKKNHNKNIQKENNILNSIFFEKTKNIQLDIVVNIINFSISVHEWNHLSEGDVVSIEKPDKIVAYIEKQPIFFCNYKIFNKQSVVFIEDFIKNYLESHQHQDITLMSTIKNKANNKSLIDSESKTVEEKSISSKNLSNENILYDSKKDIEKEKILLDTFVNITVALGKAKIKIKDFLSLSIGSMLILDKLAKEPLDVFVNNHLIASGEIVVLENNYGLRITHIKNSLKTTNISM